MFEIFVHHHRSFSRQSSELKHEHPCRMLRMPTGGLSENTKSKPGVPIAANRSATTPLPAATPLPFPCAPRPALLPRCSAVSPRSPLPTCLWPPPLPPGYRSLVHASPHMPHRISAPGRASEREVSLAHVHIDSSRASRAATDCKESTGVWPRLPTPPNPMDGRLRQLGKPISIGGPEDEEHRRDRRVVGIILSNDGEAWGDKWRSGPGRDGENPPTPLSHTSAVPHPDICRRRTPSPRRSESSTKSAHCRRRSSRPRCP